jgi:hypothetical protein
MSNINILKRFKTINKLESFYLNKPSFETVKELYLNNTIKSIASVKKTLNGIKVKKNGELFKTSVKKVQKLEESRPIKSFVGQINKSFKDKKYLLDKNQMPVLRVKLLTNKHLLQIKYDGIDRLYFRTFSEKYIDSLMLMLNNGYNGYVSIDKVSYSDAEESYNYDEIEEIDIFEINEENVNFIDNKNGLFFNFLNTTKLDLTRYQIIREEDDAEIINSEHCLFNCFIKLGLEPALINAVKLAVCVADKVNITYISKSSLNKVCSIIKKQINIHSYENKRKHKRVQIYGKEYKDILKIAMYKSHYFVYEETEYNKYFIDNYDKLKNVENGPNIKEMQNNKYFKYGVVRCDSLYLVNKLYELGYFIKDSSIIRSLVGSSTAVNIPLDIIEQEQSLYKFKNKPDEERDIFYADCESCVNGDIHSILMIGVIKGLTEDKTKTFILDERGPQALVNSFFNYIKNRCKLKKVPIIYFHNMKYDYMGLIKKYMIIKSECVKDNAVYSVNGFLNKFEYEMRDTYKLINIKLSEFPSTFGLSINKKEAIAYKYYTNDNIKQNKHSVKQYIESFEHDKDKELFKQIIEEDKNLFEYDGEFFNATKYYEHYLNYDCLVLKQGIEKYVSIINTITSKGNKTPLNTYSSLTISSLTNTYMGLNGAFEDVYTLSGNLREYVSKAVYGGRVNVCNEYKKVVINEVINDYDCTSLYPSAINRMCLEIGVPTGSAKRITDFNINEKYFIGRFKITAINKKQQNPFIAIKTKNGLNYINDLVNNEPVIVSIDKITLEDYINFHHIEYEFIDGIYWDGEFNKQMGELISELFSSRIEYKKLMKKLNDTDDDYKKYDVLQTLVKLMLNSAYGKCIITKSDVKRSFIYNTVEGKEENENINNYICNNFNTIKEFSKINNKQTQILSSIIDVSDNLGHIGVMILSYSKRIMNEVMGLASDNKIDIYYQDTDSMHLKNDDIAKLESLFFNKYNRQIRGDSMGQFHSDFKIEGAKSEVVSVKSIFLGKKSYIDVLQAKDKNGETITGYHLRMKGISTHALQYASDTHFNGEYFKLYEHLSQGNEQEFILNPYKYSVSFEYVKGGIRSRNYQEFKRIVKF